MNVFELFYQNVTKLPPVGFLPLLGMSVLKFWYRK